jgi:hypothetical protein
MLPFEGLISRSFPMITFNCVSIHVLVYLLQLFGYVLSYIYNIITIKHLVFPFSLFLFLLLIY